MTFQTHPNCLLYFFADDTTLQYSSENLESLYDFAHFELSKIPSNYLQKNPLNYYLLKVKKFHGDSVKMRVLGQKYYKNTQNSES